jgi:hypothetical protein
MTTINIIHEIGMLENLRRGDAVVQRQMGGSGASPGFSTGDGARSGTGL